LLNAECRLLFWLDAICGPNGGPAMIAWLQAFLGFPPSGWDTLNR
jgi:hypothetical protein